MEFIPYIIISIIAVFFGQIAAHLNKKLPPVVSEEITYKEFFKTLKNDFKIDIFYSLIFLILFNLLIYFVGNTYTSYVYAIVIFALSITFSVDLRYKLIPDEVHIIIAFAGIINLIFNFSNFFDYILGAIVGGGIAEHKEKLYGRAGFIKSAYSQCLSICSRSSSNHFM